MWVRVAQTMEGGDARLIPHLCISCHLYTCARVFFLERVGIWGDFQLVSHLQIDFSSIFPVKYY